MVKRDAVLAVYAESVVFESNFGSQKGPATDFGDKVVQRAQSSSAADPADQNAGASSATLLSDQVWSIF